jgi:hypothetical protein
LLFVVERLIAKCASAADRSFALSCVAAAVAAAVVVIAIEATTGVPIDRSIACFCFFIFYFTIFFQKFIL